MVVVKQPPKLAAAIRECLYFPRILHLRRNALQCIHELTAFPYLWALFPSPFYSPCDECHWQFCVNKAVQACHEAGGAMPVDVAIRQKPENGSTDVSRCGKRLIILTSLLMQLVAHADAVDYSLWPSPFDSTISKRRWEGWCQEARFASRMLHGVDQIGRVIRHRCVVAKVFLATAKYM